MSGCPNAGSMCNCTGDCLRTPDPAHGGTVEPTESEVLTWMRNSDYVKLLDIGVIGSVLSEADVCDAEGNVLDPIDLAKQIIKAQTAAGLGTFVLRELNAFIDGITTSIRERIEFEAAMAAEPPTGLPAPQTGAVWRYTSPNGDRVLVRYHAGFWESAPVTGGIWERQSGMDTWPGTFELLR